LNRNERGRFDDTANDYYDQNIAKGGLVTETTFNLDSPAAPNNQYFKNRNERGRFGALKSDSTHHFFRNACTKSGSFFFTVFRLLADFVCLYTYEF
jgi:hypothetical protein